LAVRSAREASHVEALVNLGQVVGKGRFKLIGYP